MQNRQNQANQNYIDDNNYFPMPNGRRGARKRSQGIWGVLALFFFPALFVALTLFLAYASFEPIVRPIVTVASLLVSDYEVSTQETQASRNLLDIMTERPAPEPVRIPVDTTVEYEPEPELMIPLSEIELPLPGDQYGRITISGTNVDAPVFWDDDYPVLNMGVGTHSRSVPGAWLPGFGRTVLMAGHRNTDFLDLFSAEIGEFITIETHYGTFVYEIIDIAVFHMHDTASYDFSKEYENIIVYTCYPRDFVGRAIYRLFVYGILVSGIQVDITS